MKKLKNEKDLVKKAIAEGVKYGEKRGIVEFEIQASDLHIQDEVAAIAY